MPGTDWLDIINTGRLCPCSTPVECMDSDRMWVRFPLRLDEEQKTIQHRWDHYYYKGVLEGPNEVGVGFHNTRLASLVHSTSCWNGRDGMDIWAAVSSGTVD